MDFDLNDVFSLSVKHFASKYRRWYLIEDGVRQFAHFIGLKGIRRALHTRYLDLQEKENAANAVRILSVLKKVDFSETPSDPAGVASVLPKVYQEYRQADPNEHLAHQEVLRALKPAIGACIHGDARHEVVRLFARGRTGTEIAEALIASPELPLYFLLENEILFLKT